jgi:hypothetical protein
MYGANKPIWLWLKLKNYKKGYIKNWNALNLNEKKVVSEELFYKWVCAAIVNTK